jgi:hypothetical protein
MIPWHKPLPILRRRRKLPRGDLAIACVWNLLVLHNTFRLHTSSVSFFLSPPNTISYHLSKAERNERQKRQAHPTLTPKPIPKTQPRKKTQEHQTPPPSTQARPLIPSPAKLGNPGGRGSQTSLNVRSTPLLKSPLNFSPAPCTPARIPLTLEPASLSLSPVLGWVEEVEVGWVFGWVVEPGGGC